MTEKVTPETIDEKFNNPITARKKPVRVEVYGPVEEPTKIETMEGTLTAEPGDLIIKGVKGEVYPIDKHVFNETYEVITEGVIEE